MKFIISFLVFCFALVAFAGNEHSHPAVKVSPEFEKMKGLVGNWEGKANMHGKEEKVTVSYELTSGGTAIIEKLGPGTPMEMVTMYSNRGKEIHAKHYCALGNQPEMKLKKAKDNSFAFEMDGHKGISNKNEMHMHGVTLTLDGNKLKQEWTNYNGGKKGEVSTFEFTKKM